MNVETKFEENAQEIKVTTGPLPASTKIYKSMTHLGLIRMKMLKLIFLKA